jgi:tetratricopeptide (TPR) repeat protein
MNRETLAAWAPVTAAVGLWMAAVAGATRLVDVDRRIGSDMGLGILDRALGLMCGAVGERFFERADLYFHRGIPHQRPSIGPTLFTRWAARLVPPSPLHAEGADACEILPWLRFATAMDPGNVDAYLVAAYWVERSGGRPDLAEDVLREVVRRNPRDYRPFFDWARLALRRDSPARALALLGAGLRAWPEPAPPGDPDAVRDRAVMMEMRGLLLASDGQREEALRELERAAEIRPQAAGEIRRRMEEIRAGRPGESFIPAFLRRTTPRVTCEHDPAHDGGGDAAHDRQHEEGEREGGGSEPGRGGPNP